MKLRTILVDDEIKALERIEKLCLKCPELVIVGKFTKASEVLEFLGAEGVDLALLDIEMPKINGLELAEAILDSYPSIDVVFVTAYDQYALEAFQVNAIGYLLKPIELADLQQQIDRILKKKQYRLVPELKEKMVIQCFGGFFCYGANKEKRIKWRTSKAEELFALLIQHKGLPLSKDRIIELLWPGMAYDKATKYLHAISYYIREALFELGYKDLFMRSNGMYALDIEQLDVDLYRLENLIAHGPIKGLTEACMVKVLALADGAYFEGKDFGWATGQDTYWQTLLEEIGLILAESYRQAGRTDEAITLLMKMIRRNPVSEPAYGLIIQTYLERQDMAKARQWYKTCEQNLRIEMDVAPSEAITDLFVK